MATINQYHITYYDYVAGIRKDVPAGIVVTISSASSGSPFMTVTIVEAGIFPTTTFAGGTSQVRLRLKVGPNCKYDLVTPLV